MRRTIVCTLILLLVGAAVFAAATAETGAALEPISSADCTPEERGDLDVYFCDKDGDLVADLPEDERFWLDPETLIFAYTPVEDPAIYEDMWAPFMDHLSEVTGREVQFFSVSSYTAQVEAMRAGRLHIAGISTGPTPFAVNLAGYVPIAIMGGADGQFGYTLQVYVRADSDLYELPDLKGLRVAHVTPTSNSGHQAPTALFPGEGLVPGEDYEPVFSGSHENSALGVIAGDYDAAPVASEVVNRMAERELFDRNDVRIIYETDAFPTTSFGVAHRLHPDLQEKIREAFFSYPFAGTPLGDEFEVDGFIPITYDDHWAVIRTIQNYNEVQYRVEDLD